MKILWLSLSPSLYKTEQKGYNGIGWIAALEKEIKKKDLFELAIAFWYTDNLFKVSGEKVTYYPMQKKKNLLSKWYKLTFNSKQDSLDLGAIKKVVQDYQPDLIHIFGSESNLGLICEHVNVPVVIHLQGILNPYVNAWFPCGFSISDLFRCNGLNFKMIFNAWWGLKNNQFMAQREIKIMKMCRHYMGRTQWDENVVKLLSLNAKYHYCSEVLRNVFYHSAEIWSPQKHSRLIIQSTISSPLYKGLDMILKTAKVLCRFSKLDFEWRVYGIHEAKLVERKLNIKSKDVNVKLIGVVSAEQLKISLLECSMYVHPSYIDNSPNSVCEAQILGVPVIATHVGGLASIIEHNKNGILVPANDPYMAASYIQMLFNDKSKSVQLGEEARYTALIRHNPKTVIADLVHTYTDML